MYLDVGSSMSTWILDTFMYLDVGLSMSTWIRDTFMYLDVGLSMSTIGYGIHLCIQLLVDL